MTEPARVTPGLGPPTVGIALALAAGGILMADVSGHSAATIRPPNIVFILADDLGYGDLGCYGSKTIKTPHIDRVAAEGVRLTDCYSAAPVCTPTRAALLTGRYPQKAGFEWVIRYTEKDRGLPADQSCLARGLKDAGYATGLAGKWHLGYKPEFNPLAHGFGEFFGFLAADLDFYAHTDALGDPGLYEGTNLVDRPGYLTDLITDRAVGFVHKHAGRPFFLEVAYNAPHWPFQPPGKPGDVRNKDTYGPETGTRADYVTMVERMDHGVGQILAALDEKGLRDNTLVVFTSDNGGERLSDNRPLFHGKYSLWEGGIRVPCVARWPGVIPERSVSAQPVITMDFTASLLAAGGAKPQAALDGEDVLSVLAGKQPVRERTFCWRLPRPDERYGQKAVRRGKWKLVYDREMDLLFDLTADSGERTNLAAERPEVVRELNAALGVWERTLPALSK
jgi:arylsulfatase A-like enzyme